MFDEKEILNFWEKNKIFERSVNNRKGKKPFIFYEGPPTANNVPHMGHFETRVFKDVVLRYKTMRGFYAPRRAGWDTHGLPVEVEVEKTLGLKNKKDIEKYGIAAFNKKCRESVWKYKELWERMTHRMGFWIDMERPYITYGNSYIESLWGIIKKFADKNLLYEDYKVMPWCARCGTALSSHELAQGYEKINENSIFVKFPIRLPDGQVSNSQFSNSYFLVWTTTPWTLPGNVALAVNPKIDYVFAKKDDSDETLILAESRVSALGEEFKILKKARGSEFVGNKYEPLYSNNAPYKVVGGDFVSAEEGTGIVHIAPAFGEDDFQLSKKFNLPVLATTDERGLMRAPGKPWNGEWFSALGGPASGGKKANELIIEDLKSRGLLFKTELYEHDYPFCWRCKTPLMYFARKSWWVDVNKVRKNLIANNRSINWYPEHTKEGRMGEWLKEEKNWAFSRERYWGTPLPIWRCEKCKKWETFGSIEELKKRNATSGNKYFIMRHGEAESNIKNIVNGDINKNHYPLTPRGKKQVEVSVKNLLKKKIKPDLIFSSPFLRAEETAELIGQKLSIDKQNIKIDPRFGEVYWGIFDDTDPAKYHAYYKNPLEKFEKAPPEGESFLDVKKRVWDALSEIEARYKNKTVLIISHEDPIWMLWAAAEGKNNTESLLENKKRDQFIKTAEFIELNPNFPALPRDESLILNLHKPYIDEIKLKCQCGGQMRRVSEVCDVWFDSGAMPFAAKYYPKLYPSDYITEGVDMTRGWFYTLLAVATLLGKKAPYKNIISLGHVLDEKGKKLSKSLGNFVDPMILIEKYGADPARWYFLTVNQPWDSKLFREADIKDASRRFLVILWNVLQFWKIYGGKSGKIIRSKLLINKWVLAKLSETANAITKKLDNYDIVGAARELENFVTEDISRWYIRRIRDVMKENSSVSKETSAVLRHVLLEISKLLAPFAPFISEKIWLELGNKNSVHLEDWPRGLEIQRGSILKFMQETRRIVGLALEERAKVGIKVRQPLALLKLNKTYSKLTADFLALIKAEVNVKDIVFDSTLKDEVRLDTNITPKLKEEGLLRDLIREIQSARKTAGLKPKDKVAAQIFLPKEILEIAEKYEKDLMKETGLKSLHLSESPAIKISLK